MRSRKDRDKFHLSLQRSRGVRPVIPRLVTQIAASPGFASQARHKRQDGLCSKITGGCLQLVRGARGKTVKTRTARACNANARQSLRSEFWWWARQDLNLGSTDYERMNMDYARLIWIASMRRRREFCDPTIVSHNPLYPRFEA
jgi:hypothetical protein